MRQVFTALPSLVFLSIFSVWFLYNDIQTVRQFRPSTYSRKNSHADRVLLAGDATSNTFDKSGNVGTSPTRRKRKTMGTKIPRVARTGTAAANEAAVRWNSGMHENRNGLRTTGAHENSYTNSTPWDPAKPTMIIHVGPPKTATTTVQKDLYHMMKDGLLDADNYLYLGQKGPIFPVKISRIQQAFLYKLCLRPMTEYYKSGNATLMNDLPCWKRVHDEIRQRHQQKENVILSSEFMSTGSDLDIPETFAALMESFQRAWNDDWNVIIVVGYRRYYEWVRSAARQGDANVCLHRRTKWNGGKCPSAWSRIQAWMQRDPPSAKNYYFTDAIVAKWKPYFSNIKILNFHQQQMYNKDGHITTQFLCDIVPNAPHACAHRKSQDALDSHAVVRNARDSASAAYNNIAVTAYQRGLMKGTLLARKPRHKVVQHMEDYFQQELNLTISQLPLKCPPHAELEQLLNISISLERQIWNMTDNEVEAAHREDFWNMANNRKDFCNVDVHAILDDKSSWKEVMEFLAMRASPSSPYELPATLTE